MSRSFATLVLVLAALSAPVAASADAVADLHALFDREWERDLADNPLSATYLGDPRYDDRLPDISPAAEAARNAADAKVLDDLARIPREQLPPAEQLNYDLFRHEYEMRKAALPFHTEYYSIEASGGPQSLDELAELVPFESVADYETWIRRMRAIPAFLDQYGDLLRRGAKEKRTQPRAVMERVLEPLAKQVTDRPEDSPFFERFRNYPDAIPAADRARLTAEAKQVIAESVIPAYRRFQAVFRDEYLPATRQTVGLWDTPDGLAHYQYLATYHTTTTLTPAEIHAIGLKEVARNRAEMQKVMDEVGFKGSLTDFFQHLRTDPAVLLRDGRRTVPRLCLHREDDRPRAAEALRQALPHAVRAAADPGQQRAEYDHRLLPGAIARRFAPRLLLREPVPPRGSAEVRDGSPVGARGGARPSPADRARAGADRPRRCSGARAASRPTSRAGDSTRSGSATTSACTRTRTRASGSSPTTSGAPCASSWTRACTHMEWTRQQAIDYFMANAAKTEADIVNEIDRYISDPGQALAYKIGQLKFLELRARAEQALGDRYDIRAFHDTVLATGAVPLDILERTVDEWIAAQKAK